MGTHVLIRSGRRHIGYSQLIGVIQGYPHFKLKFLHFQLGKQVNSHEAGNFGDSLHVLFAQPTLSEKKRDCM